MDSSDSKPEFGVMEDNNNTAILMPTVDKHEEGELPASPTTALGKSLLNDVKHVSLPTSTSMQAYNEATLFNILKRKPEITISNRPNKIIKAEAVLPVVDKPTTPIISSLASAATSMGCFVAVTPDGSLSAAAESALPPITKTKVTSSVTWCSQGPTAIPSVLQTGQCITAEPSCIIVRNAKDKPVARQVKVSPSKMSVLDSETTGDAVQLDAFSQTELEIKQAKMESQPTVQFLNVNLWAQQAAIALALKNEDVLAPKLAILKDEKEGQVQAAQTLVLSQASSLAPIKKEVPTAITVSIPQPILTLATSAKVSSTKEEPLLVAPEKNPELSTTNGCGPAKTGTVLCPLCEQVFGSVSLFNLHVHSARMHEGIVRYKCASCRTNRATLADLTKHSTQAVFTCDGCGHPFQEVQHYQRHVTQGTVQCRRCCPTCDQICPTFKALQEHERSHVFACRHCPQRFHAEKLLIEHQTNTHPEEELQP